MRESRSSKREGALIEDGGLGVEMRSGYSKHQLVLHKSSGGYLINQGVTARWRGAYHQLVVKYTEMTMPPGADPSIKSQDTTFVPSSHEVS